MSRRSVNGKVHSHTSRRKFIKGVGATGAVGLAGCTEQQIGTEEPATDATEVTAPIGIQHWTLRSLPDSVPQLIRRVAAADNNGGPGFDHFEPFHLGEASASDIAVTLAEVGLEVPSAHVGLGSLEEDMQGTVDTYGTFNCDTFIHAYDEPSKYNPDGVDRSERENVVAFAERMNTVASQLSDHDARLGYHNHNHEFERTVGDGEQVFDVLAAETTSDIIFEIDAAWAFVGGEDPVAVIEEYSDRVQFIHMKDMTADGEFVEIGTGPVDLAAVSDVARNEAEVDSLVYEHDAPADPGGSIGTAAGVMSLLDGRPDTPPEGIDINDMGPPGYDGQID